MALVCGAGVFRRVPGCGIAVHMTTQPPLDPNAAATPPPPAAPDDAMVRIGAVSTRLLAGAVSKRTLEALQRTVHASPTEYPWQVVNQVVLAEPCDEQELAQKALRAHRDWVVRGGRENPGKPLGLRAKTLLAKLVAQSLFVGIYTFVILLFLLLVKHKWPQANVYAALDWLYAAFPNLVPK